MSDQITWEEFHEGHEITQNNIFSALRALRG